MAVRHVMLCLYCHAVVEECGYNRCAVGAVWSALPSVVFGAALFPKTTLGCGWNIFDVREREALLLRGKLKSGESGQQRENKVRRSSSFIQRFIQSLLLRCGKVN
jgi:hypothetical protein